jgi:hypothetical protein
MASLHYSDYHSKLVHFEAQKIFPMFKKALAYSNFCHSVNTTLVTQLCLLFGWVDCGTPVLLDFPSDVILVQLSLSLNYVIFCFQ